MSSKIISKILIFMVMLSFLAVGTPAFAQTSSISAQSSTTSINKDQDTITMAKPTNVGSGGFMIAQIAYEKGRDAWPITPPEGWVHVITTDAYEGGGYKDIGQVIYYKVAGNAEPSQYVWRFTQKVKAVGGITLYGGVNTQNPVVSSSGRGGYGDSTNKNQLVAPDTNGLNGGKLISYYGFKEFANLDVPSNMNKVYEAWDRDNDYSVLAVDESLSKDGMTGSRTSYSWEDTNKRESVESEWVAQSIVLRPGGNTAVTPLATEITIFINDKALQTVNKPIVEQGRTLVPMRELFEALGAEVTWDAATSTATGKRGDITIQIPIGSTRPTVNGVTQSIDVPAKIVQGRTYIPLRFVGESLKDTVEWTESTKTIHIKKATP